MYGVGTVTPPLLTVVVPCLNEQEVIAETNRRLTQVLESLPCRFEIVYVDDGSSDATPELIRQLRDADERVKLVRLSRSFGHQVAATAGLEHSSGNAVVLIDADLQDPPEVIAEMFAKWSEGFDVAYGLRVAREGETRFKLWTAKLFYRLMNRLSEVPIPLDSGDFRLMDRKVVDAILRMPERDRYLRGMVAWAGFRQIAVSYTRAPRYSGETHYPLVKMLRFALDAVVSFSAMPLRVATLIGFATSALALLGALLAVAVRLLTSHWVTGWTSIVLTILFVGGVQLVCLGIIGEYVGRIYAESKRRPLYLIAEELGFREPGSLARVHDEAHAGVSSSEPESDR